VLLLQWQQQASKLLKSLQAAFKIIIREILVLLLQGCEAEAFRCYCCAFKGHVLLLQWQQQALEGLCEAQVVGPCIRPKALRKSAFKKAKQRW